MKVKGIAIILLLTLLISGCSGFGRSILDVIKEKYQMSDTVKSSVDQEDTARLFTTKQSIQEVEQTLRKEIKPDRESKLVNDKQVLVYDDYFVTLTKDEKDPKQTNIEVATYGFVRDNYHPSFFDGLLTYAVLNHLFGINNWANLQRQRCVTSGGCYQGYNKSGTHYKGPGSTPLFRSSLFRGGGPGEGK
ncbi:hypothetical protein JOD43_003672 [Pullulanibacillus pueri]|uniref:DUF4247 domain-containing protein n=1 Tax=Pullulanibacillus pueri TaxID=1437324 RepID=A0A8J2ZYW8_9BACL|nr:DUF4247 domain-containing protein [Pullulanibacillus pueri]MBM7683492.1 hypothetical protein [Pullulanibacillus pueri]GGH86705.1 hypothetical protein GCM10007096_35030 [Pullulanibacillus pueri]